MNNSIIDGSQKKFLKSNLVIEPLFMRWYAWSHLISPGTAAMNVVKRHVEIMNSYVDSPQQHMEAVKDPKMLGGPFMDYGYDRSEEVKALLTETHWRSCMIKCRLTSEDTLSWYMT